MKKLMFLLLCTCAVAAYAQSPTGKAVAYRNDISMYADQFYFKGKPKQVKLYYLSIDQKTPDIYWTIDYDYDKHVREINQHRADGRSSCCEAGVLVQSLHRDSMQHSFFDGYSNKHNRTVVKKCVVEYRDGDKLWDRIFYQSGDDYSLVKRDEMGRKLEVRYYYKDSLSGVQRYSYNDATGKCDYYITLADKSIPQRGSITYDKYGSPTLVEAIDNDEKETFKFATTYTYDAYGNFTRSEETYNDTLNRIVVREITY